MKTEIHTQIMWIVEHFKLIKVRVSIELSGNGALIARNDFVEIAGPDLQAIRMTRRYVANDMDFLIGELGALQLVDEPKSKRDGRCQWSSSDWKSLLVD